jgi:hypothetical protein
MSSSTDVGGGFSGRKLYGGLRKPLQLPDLEGIVRLNMGVS